MKRLFLSTGIPSDLLLPAISTSTTRRRQRRFADSAAQDLAYGAGRARIEALRDEVLPTKELDPRDPRNPMRLGPLANANESPDRGADLLENSQTKIAPGEQLMTQVRQRPKQKQNNKSMPIERAASIEERNLSQSGKAKEIRALEKAMMDLEEKCRMAERDIELENELTIWLFTPGYNYEPTGRINRVKPL
ncbi:hypothetical protein MMC18_007482 [Xylographa bjoerkii]|nr:hypothetical protein [Xylographa bjoerkii]